MTDELSDALDAFESTGSRQLQSMPLEHAPEPEPAEHWRQEPPKYEPRPEQPYPSPPLRRALERQPQALSAIKSFYRADGTRKTPDEFTWKECWLRVGRLWMAKIMDSAQFDDLVEASSHWREQGYEHPPSDLLAALRNALWAFEDSEEGGSLGRADDQTRHRGSDSRAGVADSGVHVDAG